MTQVEILKFFVDGTLLAAVGYLAIAFGRSQLSGGQAARELRSVEESMRRLIRDADEASRELNDQLLRREQGLKRTLSDIDNAEKKARDLVSNIEAKDLELRSRIDIVRDLRHKQTSVSEAAASQSRASISTPLEAAPLTSTDLEAVIEQGISPRPARTSSEKHWTEIEDEDDFGLKVDKEIRPIKRSSGLSASIERQKVTSEVSDNNEIKVPIGATLQDIIKAAHRMIQDGTELQAVAARTRLPLEQVRLLARAFSSQAAQSTRSSRPDGEPRSANKAPVDSRLGVLGSMKREIHQV